MTEMPTPTQFAPLKTTLAAQNLTPVSVAYGDGIGPEIMDACLQVLVRAGARIAVEPIEIGEQSYRAGHSSGIPPQAWDNLRTNRVLLKAPITTPQGGGYKSLNVTLRKSLGLYANIRPCRAYAPFIKTRHPHMDVLIVRENEEDLYAGIEHRQTDEVYQCLKLVSRGGCERIVRYAFEHARLSGRKRVSCFTKDNIMKMTDGLFHQVFEEIAENYPDLAHDHWIVDIGAARLADTPEQFDVLVMPNLYGDILSDVAAQIAGSVGLAPSANIGADFAMFEAIHGSAPTLAGQDIANPSGLMLAAVMMLVHVRQPDIATLVHNAWLKTIEDGIHTADIFHPETSSQQVGTRAFAEAVCARLGQRPVLLAPVDYEAAPPVMPALRKPSAPAPAPAVKDLVGIDVFVQARTTPDALAAVLAQAAADRFNLTMITNRGVKVWPGGMAETLCTDHWRCRYMAAPGSMINRAMLVELLHCLTHLGVEFIKTENLYNFDGVAGYSAGQGQ